MKMSMGKPAAALKAAQGGSKVSAPMAQAKKISGGGAGNAFNLREGVAKLKQHSSKAKHTV